MELSPILLQFLGSLVAILLLAGLAWWLKLGGSPRLANAAEARQAAREVSDHFEPVDVALDRKGNGALLADARGKVMLLRPHGAHFAGRILTSRARVSQVGAAVVIDDVDTRFGACRLEIADPSAWVQRIDAGHGKIHA